ncbi:hypothetical protein BJ546DRAFT_113376 [Cryomyces antarcticus]
MLTICYHATQRKINIKQGTSASIQVLCVASHLCMCWLLLQLYVPRSNLFLYFLGTTKLHGRPLQKNSVRENDKRKYYHPFNRRQIQIDLEHRAWKVPLYW